MDAVARHAFMTGTSTRVLRYLDRPVTLAGQPYRNLSQEVTSRVLDFQEGLRVRHWVGSNSVKAYNEQNNLRIETTLNNPGMFQVWRRAEGEGPEAPKKRRALRKGVADVALRAQVCADINSRFMEGLASFSDETPLRELLQRPTRARTRQGRRIRAIEPTGKDRELLEAIADPIFNVSGITNVSLRERLKSTAWGDGRTDKQLSARVTRHLRLLRDHGLIRKVPNRRRYQLTAKGIQLTTALSAALAASTQQLMEIAA
jgi:DNA-binding MarR family transcriptional regulator